MGRRALQLSVILALVPLSVSAQKSDPLADARVLIRSGAIGRGPAAPRAGGNTTIAVVATNARMSKAEMNRVALMADDALARTINPSHTTGDGDTTGEDWEKPTVEVTPGGE